MSRIGYVLSTVLLFVIAVLIVVPRLRVQAPPSRTVTSGSGAETASNELSPVIDTSVRQAAVPKLSESEILAILGETEPGVQTSSKIVIKLTDYSGIERWLGAGSSTWPLTDLVWVVGVRLEGTTVASFSESAGVESQDSKALDGEFYLIDDKTGNVEMGGGLVEEGSNGQSLQGIEEIEDMREMEG